jgi:hypothetical protein
VKWAFRKKRDEQAVARRSERWAFWALPLGVLAIVVTVFATAWSVHRSEELAQATGAFDRPRPHLYIRGLRVENHLRICYGAPFGPKDLTVVHLPLAVRNDGEKTMKGIELLIREPAFLAINNEFLEAKTETTLPIEVNAERHFVKSGNYAYVSFSFPDMHPGQAFGVDEPLRANDSRIEDRIEATSKDGVKMSFDVVLVLASEVTVSVASEDLHTVDYGLEIQGIKSKNADELRSSFVRAIETEREKYHSASGFFRYALSWVNPSRQQSELIYPRYETVLVDGVSVNLGNDIERSETATYTIP